MGLTAFLSYSRFDNLHDDDAATHLREDLAGEVRANLGLPFAIFQDTEDVRTGEDWKWRIDSAVQDADFLIPIVTPSFLQRTWCRLEVTKFDARQNKRAVRAIFPVYYITTRAFEDKDAARGDKVVSVLTDANWSDWRHLREAKRRSPERRSALVKLAEDIAEGVYELRKALDPERYETARTLFSLQIDLVDQNPEAAIVVIDRLLKEHPDSPLLWRTTATVNRARALALLGHREAAFEQLDLFVESLRRAFPRGALDDDPTWAGHIEAQIAMARNLRNEIQTRPELYGLSH